MPDDRSKDLKWVEIDDFTPGIITNSQYANQASSGLGPVGPVPGKTPGQASAATGCIALPNGGLGPLPGITRSRDAPNQLATGVGAYNLVNGFFVGGPINSSSGVFPSDALDSIIIGVLAHNTAGDLSYILYDLASDTLDEQNIILDVGATAQDTGGPCTMTGGLTRANSTATDVGILTWLLEYWYTGTGSNPLGGTAYVICYPDPTNPTSASPHNLNTGDTYPCQALCHQNRMVLLEAWQDFWSNTGNELLTNEVFNYTDPPNSLALGLQQEIFVQENPFGYGSWGSISASELFLVKNRQGGVVISGDLNSPTVTSLPGVTPSYGVMSRGAQTPVGFVYASGGRGLWTWNGGNVSQKVSEALEDNFFENQALLTGPVPVFRGPTVDIAAWGDWVVVTNDWVMDTNTGGWWQLPEGANGAHLWYGVSWDGDSLYAADAIPIQTHMMDVYQRSAPAGQFSWTSYPIRIGTDAKNMNYLIREVVVRAQGYGTVQVILTGVDVSTNEFRSSPNENAELTFEAGPNNFQPSMQRLTTGLVAQDITINLASTGGTEGGQQAPAPTIFSVAIGYEEQNPVSPG